MRLGHRVWPASVPLSGEREGALADRISKRELEPDHLLGQLQHAHEVALLARLVRPHLLFARASLARMPRRSGVPGEYPESDLPLSSRGRACGRREEDGDRGEWSTFGRDCGWYRTPRSASAPARSRRYPRCSRPRAAPSDLIAVKQRDGSLKCSPFYVRFGKYQGLIRGREKVVTVTVNGVLMDFTMRLGRSGEAFFVVYDPDNPEAGLTANGSESEGDSDDDEPEVTGAASVGMDSPARAEPDLARRRVQTRRRRTRTSDRRRPCGRRLGTAADGGDGTEARSLISEEDGEDGDTGAQVATLDDLKHLAEARGTPNQTLDELREVASALEAEERSGLRDGPVSPGTSRDEPRESLGATGSIGGLLPERPKLPSLGSSPAKDNGWGWLGWRGNKNAAGAAQLAATGGAVAAGGGSVSAAAATMPSTSVADPSTPRSVASSASTASEATPFGRVTSRSDLFAAGETLGTKIAVPPYDRGYLSEAEGGGGADRSTPGADEGGKEAHGETRAPRGDDER